MNGSRRAGHTARLQPLIPLPSLAVTTTGAVARTRRGPRRAASLAFDRPAGRSAAVQLLPVRLLAGSAGEEGSSVAHHGQSWRRWVADARRSAASIAAIPAAAS